MVFRSSLSEEPASGNLTMPRLAETNSTRRLVSSRWNLSALLPFENMLILKWQTFERHSLDRIFLEVIDTSLDLALVFKKKGRGLVNNPLRIGRATTIRVQ